MKNFHIEGYHLEEESLGKGCCGEVFRAKRESDGGDYVVKRYNPMSIDRRVVEDMMERQLRAPDHPGIVPLVEFRISSPPYYTVTKFERNKTLLDGKKFDYTQASELLLSLSKALGHAHNYGLVHGNFHPGNVFYRLEDDLSFSARVGDFAAGMIGDVHYIDLDESACFSSPDQLLCLGADYKFGNAEKWDVYRFGSVAYWLLNGRFPRGESYRLARARALVESGGRPVPVDPYALAEAMQNEEELQWLDRESADSPIREIVEKCLQLDTKLRPLDMEEVRLEFEAAGKVPDEPVPDEPVPEIRLVPEPDPEPEPEPIPEVEPAVVHEEPEPQRITGNRLIRWFRSGGRSEKSRSVHRHADSG
ncbi:MAG: protein kinase [Verrucomicrobiales bacterium]|nr:protein kinase [Verrucomicrobiales bacterium]